MITVPVENADRAPVHVSCTQACPRPTDWPRRQHAVRAARELRPLAARGRRRRHRGCFAGSGLRRMRSTAWRHRRQVTCSTATRPSASESRSMKIVRAVEARSSSAESRLSSSIAFGRPRQLERNALLCAQERPTTSLLSRRTDLDSREVEKVPVGMQSRGDSLPPRSPARGVTKKQREGQIALP